MKALKQFSAVTLQEQLHDELLKREFDSYKIEKHRKAA